MSQSPSVNRALIFIAVALAAMTVGHAMTLGMGSPMPYRHVALGPSSMFAAMLLVIGLGSTLARVHRGAKRGERDADWLLPAFAAIRDTGAVKVAGMVASLELLSLFANESLEQHVAGIAVGGIAAMFGTTFVGAPFLHVMIGIAAGVVLWWSSREACRHAVSIAHALRLALAWLQRCTERPRAAIQQRRFVVTRRRRTPLAYRLANRPPPVSISLA